MKSRRWRFAIVASALAPLVASGTPGCSDGPTTTGSATKPPEVLAGEKASFEFMKKNMGRGGVTKKAVPAPAANP